MAHPEQPDGDAGVTPQAEANASGRRPLRDRIRNASAEAGVVQQVVERDYAIGYLLAGIAAQPDLAGSLIFKGGTALKKLYFGDYRFSEDLDFSILAGPRAEAREAALQRAVEEAERQLRTHDPFDLEIVRYVERLPHPGGQEAFVIRIQFPWHPQPLCRIKIEITDDEPVLLPPARRDLIHGYEETLSATILAYRLEEIVAEKMRTLLQTHQKLRARGWNRPRARDYYDLWRILRDRGPTLERERLPELLAQKCAHRNVAFASLEDFFAERLTAEAQANWDTNLRAFVRDLPRASEVLTELQTLLPNFFPDLVT